LRFRIDDLNSYILLSRSYLQLRMKIKDVPGDNTATAPVSSNERAFKNGLHTIFRRANLKINGQNVNDYSDYHYWKQDLEKLFMSKEARRTIGSSMGYYDNGDADHVHSTVGYGEDNVAGEKTFAFRSLLANPIDGSIAHGKEVIANIPLHYLFSFLKAYDRVMRGMSIEIELELVNDPNIIESVLAANALTGWDWAGQGANLLVKRVVPSLRVRSSLNDAISKGFALNGFSYEDVAIYRNDMGAGSQDWRISSSVSRPTRVFVAFQRKNRLDLYESPSDKFDVAGVQSTQLFINGQPIPDLRYEVNFPELNTHFDTGGVPATEQSADKRDRTRAYMNFIALSGLDESNLTSDLLSSSVSLHNWQRETPIYSFDVANNLPADTAFTGATELLLKYNSLGSTPANYNVICWVYHEKLADIKFTSTESSIVIS